MVRRVGEADVRKVAAHVPRRQVERAAQRDEGVRELPSAKYPWDGVSGVKPFREFAATTTVGVY